MSCSSSLFLHFLIFSCLCIDFVLSHSWAHCTDYQSTITGQDYDDSQCSGYIREWQSHWGATSFATDRGINYFGSDGAWCQTSFSNDVDSMYDDGYPYAEYYIGDEITIVWPAKNHANYGCFNNIPDTSMKLYYVDSLSTLRTSDPSSLSDWTVLHDFQDGCTAGTDGCGFQNCPDFCENTDGAPCFGTFEITSDDFEDEGFYTFMWYWIFNGGTAAYTTCFEAYVHTGNAPVGNPTSSPTPRPTDAGETNAPTRSPTDASSDEDDDTDYDYFVIVPLCYDGAEYDKDTIIDGANNAYNSGLDVTDWDIRYHVTGGDSWNATIQTFTNYGATVTSGAYDYATDTSLLCDTIESEYDNVGECIVCTPGEIRLYATSYTDDITLPEETDATDEPDGTNNNNNNSNNNSAMTITILDGYLNLVLMSCVLYFFV